MTAAGAGTWRDIRHEVLRRIRTREWPPGETIPSEVALAREFRCARATVNRALRELAEAGFLERRRRAGTRVPLNPVRKATLEIPIIRHEVEAKGAEYGYALLSHQRRARPPVQVLAAMGLGPDDALIHARALHLSDGAPYALEDRWINPATADRLDTVDLARTNANEWLVQNIAYTGGRLSLFAGAADASTAETLACPVGAAVFHAERVTWLDDDSVTWVRLTYPPAFRLQIDL